MRTKTVFQKLVMFWILSQTAKITGSNIKKIEILLKMLVSKLTESKVNQVRRLRLSAG